MNNKKNSNIPYESADQVELAFYKAFGNGDYNLMSSLFADKGVTYTHLDNPRITGRKKVLDNWEFVLTDIPKADIKRKLLNVIHNDGTETHLVLESFLADEETGKVAKILTTNTFVKQANGWRLQKQHTSLPN